MCLVEADERAALREIVFCHINIDTIFVVYSRVVLDNTSNLSTILLEELGSPVADSTEALNNDCFSCNTLLFEEGFFNETVQV